MVAAIAIEDVDALANATRRMDFDVFMVEKRVMYCVRGWIIGVGGQYRISDV